MNANNNKLGNPGAISALLKKTKTKIEVNTKNSDEFLTVHHSEIVSNPQVRTIFDPLKIRELADSMDVNGQQELVTVYPKNEDGVYVIYKGERRWRALALLDANVDIRIVPKPKNKADIIIIQLIENIQRENLQPIDISNSLQDLVNDGLSQVDISLKLGKSKSYVSRHLSLQNLDDDIKKLAQNEIVNEVETLNNLGVIKKNSLTDFHHAVKLAEMGQLTRDITRNIIERQKIESEAKQQEKNVKRKKLLKINVDVELDGTPCEGTLLLQKLPDLNEMVYVILSSNPKKPVPVLISDVKFKSMEVLDL